MLIISFDPSWAGHIGSAALSVQNGEIVGVRTESFKMPSGKPEIRDLKRGNAAIKAYVDTLNLLATDWSSNVIICYENPTTWLLGAASSGRKRSHRPVTKASLNAATMAVGAVKCAIGIWYHNLPERLRSRVTVTDFNAYPVRQKLGVKDLAAYRRDLVDTLASLPGYEDKKKAAVGAAVSVLLAEEGIEAPDGSMYYPPTDHEADALAGALYTLAKTR